MQIQQPGLDTICDNCVEVRVLPRNQFVIRLCYLSHGDLPWHSAHQGHCMCHNSLPHFVDCVSVPMTSSELFTRVGRKNSSEEPPSLLVLLFASGTHERLESLLEREGYTVIVPSTADQAVAICLHNRIVAAILDRTSLEETDDWSLAQSLKMVSANTPVLLMVSGEVDELGKLPEAVDCVASDQSADRVLNTLMRHLRQTAQQKQAG